jgi:predicted DsbA family dithiol-disulfide isomerase
MDVTVFYDYNCPFCYIASRRLTLLSGEFDLSTQWKGIEIHPEFPPEGAKRGRSVKSLVLRETMGEAAGEEGIEIKSPGFAANSRLALEASEFAKTLGRFEAFHHAVYEAYFGEGLNIGKSDVLLSIGERAGIDRKALTDSLESRSMRGAVESNEREAASYTVLGVPTFILGSFPVHGCQSLETMRAMIERALSRL